MKRTLLITAALLAASPLLAAPTVEQVREQESGQQQILTQTQQVGRQIESIIGEFERNGLGDGEDVKTLKAIHGMLGRLSTKDMNKVIQLLQDARGQSSPDASSRTVTEAYTTQKGVIAQLRQLLIEYQRQQQLFELSTRFSQLAERQHANLKVAVHLAQDTTGKPADQFSLEQKDSLQVQQSEQTALKDEVGQAMLVLKAATDAAEAGGAISERLKQAMQVAQDHHLNESVASAIDDLRQGSLFRAATSEKNARDQLRDIARLVAPPQDRVGALKQAMAALDHHIEEQAKVNDASKALNKDRPDVAPVAEKQADLVDRTDLTRKDLQTLVPAAADQVKSAEQKMQQVRAALGQKNKDEAIKQGDQAAQDLQKARESLKQELAKAIEQQQQQNQPQDAIAALNSLLERVKELIKQQTALQGKTQGAQANATTLRGQSPEQTKLKESTRTVQQDALQQSPPASDSLGEAARQMQTAAATLSTDPQPQKALDNQKQALTALQRAEQQLTQELAKKEETQKKLAQLEKAREKLAKAIEQQQKVETKTARQVAKQDADQPKQQEQPKDQQANNQPKPENKPEDKSPTSQPAEQASKPEQSAPKDQQANAGQKDQAKPQDKPAQQDKQQQDQAQQQAAKQLAQEQTKVSQQTEDAQNQLPDDAQKASDALKQAQQNMQQATNNLNKADPKAANPDQKQALDHLQQAKNTLDDKIQDLKNELGQPTDPTQAMDNVAQAIDKAQTDLGNTMDQLPPDPRQQAMQDLQKQQQKLANDIKQQMDAGQQANQPQTDKPQPDKTQLAQAQQAAQKAAEQLADNDPKAAAESMKQAKDALDQAQKDGQKPNAPEAKGAHPALPELAGKQEELRKQAEALAQGSAQPPDLGQAANNLAKIAQDVAKAGAEDQGALPASVSQALQQAQQKLSQAAAKAEGKNLPQTQANAQQAQQALAQAKAALAMAQQGLEQGKAMAMTPGQPMPGMMPGMQPGMQAMETPGPATGDRQNINGGGPQTGGPRNGATAAASSYLGLPPRDRQALQQSQKEKYPAEYAPMIEQYLRNLSDSDQQ